MKKYIFTGFNLDCVESHHVRDVIHGEFSGRRIGYDMGPCTLWQQENIVLNYRIGENAQECCELGTHYLRLGMVREARREFTRACALDPDSPLAHSFRIIGHDYTGETSLRRIQDLKMWASRHIGRESRMELHTNNADSERCIRVGYVSADFMRHSAFHTWFPILREHDRGNFHVTAYFNGVAKDDYSLSCRMMVNEWREICNLTDAQFADLVREECIDILVDLSGHTGGHRLKSFAEKPAPIQFPGFGFVEGNGLTTTDYVWGDQLLLTSEERKAIGREVLELPSAFWYEPPADCPEVSPLPVMWGEPFTFGCFNKLDKINDDCLRLWVKVLDKVPGSRLILKDKWYSDYHLRVALGLRLRNAGFNSGQVTLYGETQHFMHMECFDEVDVSLDPFPHGGGTSAAESLWMGVPVISMYGVAVPGRMAASMLFRAGLGAFIARDEKEYIVIAAEIGKQRSALANLRATMRARLLASPAFNPRLIVQAIEDHYRSVWRRWCAARIRQRTAV